MAGFAGKVKRSLLAQFLNTTPSADSPTWSRMGDGITTGSISYGAETTEEQYIHEDSASKSISAYAPSLDTEQTAIAGDDVFDFVDALRQSRAIGSATETDLLLVYLYDYTESGTGTITKTYSAEKQKVSIEVTDFGGDAGDFVKINYNVNFVGDAVIGTAVIADGVPTFTPANG